MHAQRYLAGSTDHDGEGRVLKMCFVSATWRSALCHTTSRNGVCQPSIIFCLFSLPTYYSGSLLDQIFFMAKKSSLKAALNSQQNRLKKNAKVQEAAQKQNLNALSKAKGKAKAKASPSHATVPFRVEDKILLIGEGNFSFSLALFQHPALQYLPPCNVTATSYDSELECEEKYPESKVIIEELRSRAVEVLFNVDATTLEKCKSLKGRKWDRIVWNFPHAGTFSS